jgi:hypothetical protein
MSFKLPIEIRLPEKVMLENETMFVILRTLDEFNEFWTANKAKFPFAASQGLSDSVFLGKYEWVFGATKAAVVQTVMRWGRSGVECEFYDWSKSEPEWHKAWFLDRESTREDAIRDGSWTEADQAAYEKDCVIRTPESYRGWWRLKNIPGGCDPDEWLSDYQEIFDPNLPIAEVERLLQEQTFDDWLICDLCDVRSYCAEPMDSEISPYLFSPKDYFNIENWSESDEIDRKDSALRPARISITIESVDADGVDAAEVRRIGVTDYAASSPFSTLTTAVETIASELEMMLDIELDGFVADVVDAHNLQYLQEAIADANTALNAICGLGVSGSKDALAAFLSFTSFAAQIEESDIQEIRDAYAEVDPQEFLEDYVIKAIANFAELRDAEEDFDSIAEERKALPPKRAD